MNPMTPAGNGATPRVADGDLVTVVESFEVAGFLLNVDQTGTIDSIEEDGTWWVAFTMDGDDSDEDEAETLEIPPDMTCNLEKAEQKSAFTFADDDQQSEGPSPGDQVVLSSRFVVEEFDMTPGMTGTIESIEDDGVWRVAFVLADDESDEDEAETLMVPPELTRHLRIMGASPVTPISGGSNPQPTTPTDRADMLNAGDQVTVREAFDALDNAGQPYGLNEGQAGRIDSIEDDGAWWVVFTTGDDSDDEDEAETLMVPPSLTHMLERFGRAAPRPVLGLGVSVVMQPGPEADELVEQGDSVVVARPFALDGFELTVGQTGIIDGVEDDGTWWVVFQVAGDESDEDEEETLEVPAELTRNLRKT